LAVAKRHGISELTIYKGCKRSSGFQANNIKRLTQPTSGAINLSSVLSSAALPQGNEPRDLKLRTSYAGQWLGRKGTRRTVLVGTSAVAIATLSLVALFPIGSDQRRPL
jgi:hypothetical protein